MPMIPKDYNRYGLNPNLYYGRDELPDLIPLTLKQIKYAIKHHKLACYNMISSRQIEEYSIDGYAMIMYLNSKKGINAIKSALEAQNEPNCNSIRLPMGVLEPDTIFTLKVYTPKRGVVV